MKINNKECDGFIVGGDFDHSAGYLKLLDIDGDVIADYESLSGLDSFVFGGLTPSVVNLASAGFDENEVFAITYEIIPTVELIGGEPSPAVVYNCQWQSTTDNGANWADISKATDIGYSPVAGDYGKKLRCKIIASGGGYGAVETPATDAIAAAFGDVSVVCETPVIGATASLSVSYIGEPISPTLTYQWFRTVDHVWTEIEGETSAAYTLAADDVGESIMCEITGSGTVYGVATAFLDKEIKDE